MQSCPDIWNVFHDATVLEASGEILQDVVLRLECDYLRERFDEPGREFLLTLAQCSTFEFEPWGDEPEVITDIQQIGNLRLWILSAETMVNHCKIHCARHVRDAVGGTLRVAAASAELRLDSGRPVPLAEIQEVAEEYWTEFSTSRPDESGPV